MVGSFPILMVCAGAVPWAAASLGQSRPARSIGHAKITRKAGLSRVVALVLLVASPCLEAVVCETCKDTIGGCNGGANCPLLKAPSENAAAINLKVSEPNRPDLLAGYLQE